MCLGSRDLFNFGEITENMSKTVEDRDMDIVKDYRKS